MSSGVYGRGWRLGAGEGFGTGKVGKGSREVKLFEITPPPPIKNTGIGIKSGRSQS